MPGHWHVPHAPAQIEPEVALRLAVLGPSTVYRITFAQPDRKHTVSTRFAGRVTELIKSVGAAFPDATVEVTEITVSATWKDLDPATL